MRRRAIVERMYPLSVVLADGGASAVLAFSPLSVVLADGGAPAVLAFAPDSVVLADGGAPASFCASLICGDGEHIDVNVRVHGEHADVRVDGKQVDARV